MDIKVLPLFRASLWNALHTEVLLLLLEHIYGDWVLDKFDQVFLRQAQSDRDTGKVLEDLWTPLVDAIEWVLVVGGDADHEDISAYVLGLTIDAEVLISTGIMDLDLHLLFLDILDASVDVEDCRLVVLRERIVEIVTDQARFTNRGVADEHYFDFLNILLSSLWLFEPGLRSLRSFHLFQWLGSGLILRLSEWLCIVEHSIAVLPILGCNLV